MGRLAETEGESAISGANLRMKLFIDPDPGETSVPGQSGLVAGVDERVGGRPELLSGETSAGNAQSHQTFSNPGWP